MSDVWARPFRGAMGYPHYPRQLKIEPVYGCDKRCPFCELANSDHRTEFMDTKMFCTKIATGFDSRYVQQVGYSIHGEPTLHPDYLYMLQVTRNLLPNAKILTSTNGYQLRQRGDCSYLLRMFECGVSHVMLDCYDKQTADIFKETWKHTDDITVKSGTEENIWNSTERKLIIVNDTVSANFREKRKGISQIDTQGSSMPYENWKKFGIPVEKFPMDGKTCKELNKYMTIKFDGNVPVCCADGSRSLFVGNVNENTIEEIWKGRRADIVRWALHRGLRSLLPPCYCCNRASFRDALWSHWGAQYSKKEMYDTISENATLSTHYLNNMAAFLRDYPDKEVRVWQN